jgi:hypothetical protein
MTGTRLNPSPLTLDQHLVARQLLDKLAGHVVAARAHLAQGQGDRAIEELQRLSEAAVTARVALRRDLH